MTQNNLARFQRNIAIQCIPNSHTSADQGRPLRETLRRILRKLHSRNSRDSNILAQHTVNWTSLAIQPVFLLSKQVGRIKCTNDTIATPFTPSPIWTTSPAASEHGTTLSLTGKGYWDVAIAMSRKLGETAWTLIKISCLAGSGIGSLKAFRLRTEVRSPLMRKTVWGIVFCLGGRKYKRKK